MTIRSSSRVGGRGVVPAMWGKIIYLFTQQNRNRRGDTAGVAVGNRPKIG